jgi:type IV fimbrial biogenesis protein FimT
MGHKKSILGFSLLELLFALALAAILLTIAVPSFQQLTQKSRLDAWRNELIAALNFTRTEAVKRSAFVSICPAANAAATACGTERQWSQGWIVFVDSQNRGQITDQADRLRVREPLPKGTAVQATMKRVTFAQTGFVAVGAGSLSFSPPGCSGGHVLEIQLLQSGRVEPSQKACQ